MIRRFTAMILLALSVLALMPFHQARAARNPFISSQRTKDAPAKNPATGYPAFLRHVMDKIAVAQQTIKQKMVRLAHEIQQRPFGRSFWGFMLLSFLYGVIHALGPGHGKIYTCSYFLSRPGTFKKGLLFGNLTMLSHVLSGTALILVGAFVLRTSGALTLENSGVYLERVSYGILAALGLFLTGRAIYEYRTGKGHSHADHCPQTSDMKSLVVTALAIGLVPCPGAALILLFSLTLGILPAGLAAMVCVASGMAITSSLFAFLAIRVHKTFLTLAQGNASLFNTTHTLLTLGGAMCISALGALLLLGSF